MRRTIQRVAAMAAATTLLAMTLATVSGESASSAPPAAASPELVASASSAMANELITITGTRWNKKATVTITVSRADTGVTTSSSTATTSGSGWFSASVRMPNVAGDALVTARTSSSSSSVRVSVAAPAPSPTPEPSPTSPATDSLRFGVSTPQGPLVASEIAAVAALVGEQPSIELWYEDFAQPLSLAKLAAVDARGAVPLITWEPWRWGGGITQPDFRSSAIASGTHDAYLRSWGTALATWGKPVMLRYGHEMNGDWYPWADGVNGNRPGDYVAAWRHVHSVLTAQGATNVQWVWSPNVPYPGSTALPQLYPGDAVVDIVALDGYNWGTSQSWSGWQSPSELFGAGLSELRMLAPGTEILIAETASSEQGGSKAAWNTELIAYLDAQPDVRGFVWFDYNKETDWRIASSTSSATALASALAARD